MLPASECRQAPCQQEPCPQARSVISHLPKVLHTWVAAAAAGQGQRALPEFSTVHPAHGITPLGAPPADHLQSFENPPLSWAVGLRSHGIALRLLPGRLCLLSNGNITPWESCHLFCCTVTWPLGIILLLLLFLVSPGLPQAMSSFQNSSSYTENSLSLCRTQTRYLCFEWFLKPGG